MRTTIDPHEQFAEFFRKEEAIKPFAYLLSQKLADGHICLNLDDLEAVREAMPPWYGQLLEGPEPLMQSGLVSTTGAKDRPFILDGNRLYLQRYFLYETTILKRILAFAEEEQAMLAGRMEALRSAKPLVLSLFPDSSSGHPDWQLIAALTAALRNFCIITGGPGTGKTTTVARLLALLHRMQPGLKIALAAPTGKAAARMAESLSQAMRSTGGEMLELLSAMEPSTIHRLLGSRKNSPYFRHDAANPLAADVVIADESSMIDAALLAKLMQAVKPGARLILLGDKDQLASVEAGSLFGDLCQALPRLNAFSKEQTELLREFVPAGVDVPEGSSEQNAQSHPLQDRIVMLTVSRRFDGSRGIGRFSKMVMHNDQPALQSFLESNNDQEVRIDESRTPQDLEAFAMGYADYIREPDNARALECFGRLRVLCAMREGPQGLYAMNREIEQILEQHKLLRVNAQFYANRPVILTRNYYEHGLFNGDTGIARPDERGQMMVHFQNPDGSLKAVPPGYLGDCETAFAMTIHRSQGSEYDRVLICLPDTADAPILTRELLYTAVTRAKRHATIRAGAAVVLQTSARRVQRASGIAARMSKAAEDFQTNNTKAAAL